VTPRDSSAGGNSVSDERQYCTFYLCGEYYGIDVLTVQEVIRGQQN